MSLRCGQHRATSDATNDWADPCSLRHGQRRLEDGHENTKKIPRRITTTTIRTAYIIRRLMPPPLQAPRVDHRFGA